eukprot:482099-Hanusia_phi.AAC.1
MPNRWPMRSRSSSSSPSRLLTFSSEPLLQVQTRQQLFSSQVTSQRPWRGAGAEEGGGGHAGG